MIWIVLLVAVGAGAFAYFRFSRPRPPKYFATCEYWVFLPGTEMPDQNAVMDRTIGRNPYHHRGRDPVNVAEGLLFSDIRLHIVLALRKKNPHAFGPAQSEAELSPEVLAELDRANAFVKVRYTSEEPLRDTRHLQFLPHVADAVAELGEGRVLYDVEAKRFLLRGELQDLLRTQAEVSGPDVHARVVWRPSIDGGWAETYGLVKVGHPELRTDPSPSDQATLFLEVLQAAVQALWREATLPPEMEVSAFGDVFLLLLDPTKSSHTLVRILRIQSL